MVEHLRKVHNLGDNSEDNIKCPICDYSAYKEEQVIKHIEIVHDLPEQEMSNKINKPCRYFKEKRCFKGSECKFMHENLKTNNDLARHKKNHARTGFQCMLCDYKAEIEGELVKHLANAHDITNKTDTTNKSEENRFHCPLCDHSEDNQQNLVKHLEVEHKLMDMSSSRNTNTNKTNQNQTIPPCHNGISCRYLRENRCSYFHEEAAQQEERWEEVRSRQPRSNNNYHNNLQNNHLSNNHNNHPSNQNNNQSDGVGWCRQELRCSRGRKCKYKHPAGRPGFVIQRRNSGQSLGDFFPERNQGMRM